MIQNMTEGNIPRQLLSFALPLMLANCLQTLYTTVDALVIGRFVGTSALSAVSNGGELVNFYSMLAVGFSAAGQIIISQFAGKNDREAIRKTIGSLFTMLTVLAVLLSVFVLFSANWQLRLINLPEEAFPSGRAYLLICGGGLIFVYLYNTISAILRGMGDSKRPLVFIAVASLMNLGLDLLFVVGFRWGAAGAALATILGQATSVVTSLIYLYRRRESFGFDFKPASFRPEWTYLKMLLHLGIPMSAQFAAVLLSVLFINSRINLFGVAASAATGVGAKLENIIRIVSNSVGTAASSMIGQNIAVQKHDRVKRILGTAILICTCWAAVCTVVILLIPEKVFGLFDRNPEVLRYARVYAPAAAICFLGNGLRASTNALINGIGFASLSLVSGLLDGVAARIGFSVLLAYACGMGILGFWMGSALAGWVPVFIGVIYYLSGRWKTHRLITQK